MGVCMAKKSQKSRHLSKNSFTLTTPRYTAEEAVIENHKSIQCLTKTTLKDYKEEASSTLIRKRKSTKLQIKSFLVKSYSVLNQKQLLQKDQSNEKTVQHNITGKIRTAITVEKEDDYKKDQDDMIDDILKNSMISSHFANVVDIYQDTQAYYILREHCHGEHLGNLCGSINENDIILILTQIFDVIEKIHNRGKYHGSLTINSFQLLDNSNNYYIKLVDILPIFENNQNEDVKEKQSEDIYTIGKILHLLMFNTDLTYQAKTLLIQKQKQQQQSKNILYQILIKLISNSNDDIYYEFKNNVQFKKIIKQQSGKLFAKQLQQDNKMSYTQQQIIIIMHELFFKERQEQLENIFKMLDLNNNGTLEVEEIQKELGLEYTENIFSKIDGQIDQQQFILYYCDKSNLLTEFYLNATFQYLTKKSFITPSHITNLLESDLEKINKDFQAFNGQKRLSKEEFTEMMQNLISS